MADFIAAAIVILTVGAALRYIIRAKKRGVRCIGCPDASGCCSCGCGAAHGKADEAAGRPDGRNESVSGV